MYEYLNTITHEWGGIENLAVDVDLKYARRAGRYLKKERGKKWIDVTETEKLWLSTLPTVHHV